MYTECRFKVVIPARYGSTRLPGKPLRPICGKPMILHVCDRANEADAEEIVVATDDERIYKSVTDGGFEAMMTRSDHRSGTDRIAEVAERRKWKPADIIVNLQGDEPLISAGMIRDVAFGLAAETSAGVATLATPIVNEDDIFDPNTVKVVEDRLHLALYFSRAPIPWDRESFAHDGRKPILQFTYLRHVGIYAYSVAFLARYTDWQGSALEAVESLEQLRILWQGERIRIITVDRAPDAGVDTKDDLLRVERAFCTNQ